MLVYAVDLGTTNTKVVLYDGELRRLALASAPTPYDRHGERVEFDPATLFALVLRLVHECAAGYPDPAAHAAVVVVTGQAESFVLVGDDGAAVRPGMSWLDDRATTQAEEIAAHVGADAAFAVTGEPESTATWPAAKLRWLSQHEPASLDRTDAVLMIKDDVVARLTGSRVGERTTRGFSYLYDVVHDDYWDAGLDLAGVSRAQLPPLVTAGTEVGAVLSSVVAQLPPAASWTVNAGALDHFCAMVGTGSYRPDVVSESSGTVLSLSVLPSSWSFDPARRVSFHHGLRDGETILFTCADSGGVALEWFRREGLAGMPFDELESALTARGPRDAPVFLPHLTGVNPPDFLPDARGAFVGLQLHHDRVDLAYAVEEGVAHLLRRNVDDLATGAPVRQLVSTGGGSASAFWSQLKADVTGVDVVVPSEPEATCRGAAVLALVAAGELDDLGQGSTLHVPDSTCYRPRADGAKGDRELRYRAFEKYLYSLYAH